MNLGQQFFNHLCREYPGLNDSTVGQLSPLVSENLLSPFEINLPRSILTQAENIVRCLFQISHQKSYIDSYSTDLNSLGLTPKSNFGIMMSYDFHLDSKGILKLIEVNTNAAFLILGLELYKFKNKKPWDQSIEADDLKKCILKELKLASKNENQTRIGIIDDKPESQRLFIEFLVAQELFKKFGFQCGIYDTQDPRLEKLDFIYNRDTDFYFQQPKAEKLKKLYESGLVCVSPHPFEYFLMADKQRMIDWSLSSWQKSQSLNADETELIKRHVPESLDFLEHSKEEIWKNRKKYFIKPKRAFGSKHTYRGGSMSHKAFDQLNPAEFMAQEFIPAPELAFETPTGTQNFKYDLRFYVYQDQVQLVLARIYQGQVTNLKTPLGGFATVQFKAE